MGYSPVQLLRQIQEITISQQVLFNEIYEKTIIPSLVEEKIFILNEKQLNVQRGDFVKSYFHDKVLPALVPIMVDGLKDFPFLRDKSVYLLVKLSRKDGSLKPRMALIEIPTHVQSRFLVLPESGDMKFIIMLDDVIRYCLDELFSIFRYNVFDAYTIKLTRDAELDLDNDVNERYIDILSRSLKQRSKGNPVRFVFDKDILPDMLRYVVRKIGLKKPSLIPGARYHNFKDYINFPKVGRPQLQYTPIQPLPLKDLNLGSSFFSVLKQKDILLHLPYQSFDYVVQFLREAAIDPKVKTIKITLYRLAKNSRIINALINAARNGKSVFVLVELKARFDEEANIFWSDRLEEEGVKVFTGFSKLKVHSKICLIGRMEGKKEVFYSHLSTGNYNENTSGLYCDQSFFTSDQRLSLELNDLFHELQAGSFVKTYHYLWVAPIELRKKMFNAIDQEINFAKKGLPSRIILKVNSLVDEFIIRKLYEASNAGVKVDLIVRGMCCLVPGLPGFSENIHAISIVDKFLEHSRIYWFSNNGKEKLYLSSADMMTRNLDRRIEVAFPIMDPNLIKEVKHILDIQLKDNTKARILDKDYSNSYQVNTGQNTIRSQTDIYNYLKGKLSKDFGKQPL